MRPETRIKATFVIVAVLFSLQYRFAKRVMEPYPALLMPAFNGARADSAGQYLVGSAAATIHFVDGTDTTVTLRRIFAAAPSSQYWPVAEGLLRPRAVAPPRGDRAPSGLARLAERFLPGYIALRNRRWDWHGVDPATRTWLYHRIGEMFPNQPAASVTIRWFDEYYRWRPDGVTHHQILADSLVVAP